MFRRLALNTISMSSVTLLRMLAQIMVVPVLARILSPHDYGLVAMAMPVVLFAMMFSDAGLSNSLVRYRTRDPEVWSTSFWLVSGLGGLLTLLLCLVAPLMAHIMGQPELTLIIIGVSVIVLLQSLATVPGAVFQHEHRFGMIAGIEIASLVVSIASVLLAAMNGMGAWSLVIQQILQYISKLTLTWWFAHFRPRLVFRPHLVREHLVFGRDLLGANFSGFLFQLLETLIIGRFLGTAQLGIFSMALLFARLPSRVVSGPLQFVLYPYFSQIRHDAAATRLLLLFLTRAMAIVVFPSLGLLAVAHEPFFRLLLSEKWAAAGTTFMLVAPAIALQTVTSLRFTVAMAAGNTGVLLRNSVEGGIVWILFLLGAVWGGGMIWVAATFTLAALLYLPRSIHITLKTVDCPTPVYFRALAVPTIVTASGVTAYSLIQPLATTEPWTQLGLALLLLLACSALSAALQIRVLMTEVRALRPEKVT